MQLKTRINLQLITVNQQLSLEKALFTCVIVCIFCVYCIELMRILALIKAIALTLSSFTSLH
jgi:hypothetical protein